MQRKGLLVCCRNFMVRGMLTVNIENTVGQPGVPGTAWVATRRYRQHIGYAPVEGQVSYVVISVSHSSSFHESWIHDLAISCSCPNTIRLFTSLKHLFDETLQCRIPQRRSHPLLVRQLLVYLVRRAMRSFLDPHIDPEPRR